MMLFFVAGEPSGDARGAELMAALREQDPALEFCGAGGPKMRAKAGEKLHDWSDRAVIGIIDVIRNYGYFRQKFRAMLEEINRIKPDAVVLIDYPGFNLRLARALKKGAASPRIIYYVSPQVWAWHRSRIPKMAQVVDLMICILPFEKQLYEKSGLKTIFVGHPMLDSLAQEKREIQREPELVGLFPGSREREVSKIFPIMLEAVAVMKKQMPQLRFEAAAASEPMRDLMEKLAAESVRIGFKNAHELMQRAAVGMVASGTATLEAAYFGLPYVLIYRVAPLTYSIGRRLVQVKHLGIVNILAGREVVREFLQDGAQPHSIAEALLDLLRNPPARDRLTAELGEVINLLGEPGAARRAANAILAELEAPMPARR